jgi:hypothetical protein
VEQDQTDDKENLSLVLVFVLVVPFLVCSPQQLQGTDLAEYLQSIEWAKKISNIKPSHTGLSHHFVCSGPLIRAHCCTYALHCTYFIKQAERQAGMLSRSTE